MSNRPKWKSFSRAGSPSSARQVRRLGLPGQHLHQMRVAVAGRELHQAEPVARRAAAPWSRCRSPPPARGRARPAGRPCAGSSPCASPWVPRAPQRRALPARGCGARGSGSPTRERPRPWPAALLKTENAERCQAPWSCANDRPPRTGAAIPGLHLPSGQRRRAEVSRSANRERGPTWRTASTTRTRSRRSRRSSRTRAMGACSSWSTTRTARTRATSSSPRRWRRRTRSTSWRPTAAG